MELLTTVATALGIYRLLPAGLRSVVNAAAEAWVEQALQAAGAELIGGLRGSAEIRQVRRSLARAVGLTLAKHPQLDAIAVATDFRNPPLSSEVLRIITDPEGELDPVRVRRAFAESRYDLDAIAIDGVTLLREIQQQFARQLKEEPKTRAVWMRAVVEQLAGDVRAIRDDVEWRQALQRFSTPLLEADEFFDSWLRPGRLFTHSWDLVGRTQVEAHLTAFGQGKTGHHIGVLPGRGGIGKTRLLLAVTDRLRREAPDLTVRVAAESAPVSAEDVGRLSAESALIIVDDAHRRSDLDIILSAAQRRPGFTRVLMATRPYGVDTIRGSAARIGFDRSEVLILDEITELHRTEAVQLAGQALGPEYLHLAESLAEVTKDSPLVTVVGGRLLAEESLAPGLLAHHEDFREAVLGRMADEYADALGRRVERATVARILELVAAIGPFRPDSSKIVDRAATFLDIRPDELKRVLGQMEEAGMLVRQGGSVRITPDVLADYLYHRAAVSGGQATGYVERVFHAFAGLLPRQVLENLSELDWQTRHSRDNDVDLLGAVWEDVVEEFRAASHYGRVEILKLLEPIATFQPRRAIELIELAIDSPSTGSEPTPVLELRAWSQSDVLKAAAPLLRRVAYHPDYRMRALDRLWEIARDDARPLNQHPDHGIRILGALAGYDTGRLEMAASVLDAIERWMEQEEVHGHAHSVLEVVDPVLAKAGSRIGAEDHQLTFHPYFVDPDTTRPIRDRALRIVERFVDSTELRVVLRGVKSLADAVRDPLGQFAAVPSEDLRQRWTREQLRVMEIVARLADGSRDPLVTIAALEAISWHACYSQQPELRTTARRIAKGAPWSFEMLLTKHMTGGHYRLDMIGDCEGAEDVDQGAADRWERRANHLATERDRVSDDLVANWPDPRAGAEVIMERLRAAQDARERAHAGEFLAHLARRHPGYGVELARNGLAYPEAPLAAWVAALIGGFMFAEPETAIEVTSTAALSHESTLRAAAAVACGQAMYDRAPDERYVAILRGLLTDSATWVLKQGMHALASFSRHHRDRSLELALGVALGSDSKLADDLFAAVATNRGKDFDGLSAEAVKKLLAKLEAVEDLSEYWTDRFLNHASKIAPREVVQLILRRARTEEATDNSNFRAMPYRFEASLSGFGEVPDREDLLREIRDLSVDAVGGVRFWLPELYSAVSQHYDEIGRLVLAEWIDSGDAELIAAVARLLAPADWRFVLSQPEFATNLLDRARGAGPECLDTATAALHQSVGTRGGTGVPGEPMPHDVEARDSAMRIAKTLPAGSVGREFFEAVAADAERSIQRHLEWDEEVGS